jgi:hypothetical protein
MSVHHLLCPLFRKVTLIPHDTAHHSKILLLQRKFGKAPVFGLTDAARCETSSCTVAESMQRHPTLACKAAHASKAAEARTDSLTHDNL